MYDHKKIEPKWQKTWEQKKTYKTADANGDKADKAYILDMFPYPSGEGLHVGHPKGYIATDIYSRFKRMNGKNVLHPMGWDAFGLPAENYAIKNKVHPRVAVDKNIARYKEQLSIIGLDYDWSREINTTDPAYYKWTQWIFLKLYERGLAFQSFEPINWCPSCQTGLANEDLEGGKCERCGSVVEKRPMRQWTLKITDYADRLLADLDSRELNWPASVKESQRHWIGRSEGLRFSAPVKDTDLTIQTFSTHFEAFYADTFVVIAPDHPLLPQLLRGVPNQEEIVQFCQKILAERSAGGGFAVAKEPEGIFTGRYIVDPVGNGDLPIWIANFALADYGTGIVKCSAHDERDFAFAKKYNIPLKPVLFPTDPAEKTKVENLEVCFTDAVHGVLSAPAQFAGKNAHENRAAIADYAVTQGFAEKVTMYKLRDWVFSRQRYWGEPIPMIHCEKCGVVPVPEKDLPVTLPEVEHYEPTGTGESPLAAIESWVNVPCPKCGGAGKRETNTMPQWAGSSWYYLRYMDPKNSRELVAADREKYFAPVDVYVGGAEHATRHLIYARFWHKFLYDIGVVSTTEPFTRLHNVGLILAEDGRKMSKRYGNVINPDEIVNTYGADTLRVYEMFLGPFGQATAWDTKAIMGARRFVERIWRIGERGIALKNAPASATAAPKSGASSLTTLLHKTIKKVTDDIEQFNFNTAISALMVLSHELETAVDVSLDDIKTFMQLCAPFAPHVTEEMWAELSPKKLLRSPTSIHLSTWPTFDSAHLQESTMTIVIQVNSKVRDEMSVATGTPEADIVVAALEREAVKKWLNGSTVRKTIYVPGRILNLVI